MVYYVAYILIQRSSQLNTLIESLGKMEQVIFAPNRDFRNVSQDELRSKHRQLTKTINDFLNLTRRFAIQAKDSIGDPERDEVVSLVRSLDSKSLSAMKQFVTNIMKETKGSTEPTDS